MAVAFMANAQHLYTRTDILTQAGITAPPATYEEVLVAAEAIRAAGIMEYPLALNTKAGWNLAEEFVNHASGHGRVLLRAGSAEPAINNETGVATLNMLKALVAYSNPDFLTFDSNATQALWGIGRSGDRHHVGLARGGPSLMPKGPPPRSSPPPRCRRRRR